MTRWEELYELASSQAGYFTSAQASAEGVSRPLLDHHVKAGRIQRVRRGVYRLVRYPPSDNEDLVVVWLWSKSEGIFSHETALALHELSDALPSKIHMTLPTSWRTRRVKVPKLVVLSFDDLKPRERTWKGTVPVTTPARTVLDCARAGTSVDLVRQAIAEGIKRGLFASRDVDEARRQVAP